MRLPESFPSSHLRLAMLVVGIVSLTYLCVGWFAYHAVGTNLTQRTQAAARLSNLELEELSRSPDVRTLLEEANSRGAQADPDDTIIWVGDPSGVRLAGQELRLPGSAQTGDYDGADIGRDPEDRYHVVVNRLPNLILVTGQSYEESESISSFVLVAFLIATLVAAVLASILAWMLAQRGHKRIDAIERTLRAVAAGDLDSRITLTKPNDDLSQLSVKINSALDQLSNTVAGIRQVSVDIAHDLRTPINRLGIRLERLQSELQPDSRLKEQAEEIRDEARQLTQTFDALLRISQIEAGARRARFQALALPEISARLKEAYEVVAEEAGQSIRFTVRHSNNLTLVLGDMDLLIQLFANLIENAICHAGRGAQITVEIHATENKAVMSVADNGPGIPEAEREKVLGRFYRLEKSRTSKGNGLGLALAHAIAKLHNADLQLSDCNPGLKVSVAFAHFQDASKEGDA